MGNKETKKRITGSYFGTKRGSKGGYIRQLEEAADVDSKSNKEIDAVFDFSDEYDDED